MFSRRSIWHAPGSRSPIGIVCARHPLDTLYAPLDGFCVDDLTFSDRETLSRNLSASKVIRMSNRHYFNVKSLPIKLIILSFTLSGRNSKLTTKFRELSHRRTIRIPPAKRRDVKIRFTSPRRRRSTYVEMHFSALQCDVSESNKPQCCVSVQLCLAVKGKPLRCIVYHMARGSPA